MIDAIGALTFGIIFMSLIIITILCFIGNELKKLNNTMEKFLNQYSASHSNEKT